MDSPVLGAADIPYFKSANLKGVNQGRISEEGTGKPSIAEFDGNESATGLSVPEPSQSSVDHLEANSEALEISQSVSDAIDSTEGFILMPTPSLEASSSISPTSTSFVNTPRDTPFQQQHSLSKASPLQNHAERMNKVPQMEHPSLNSDDGSISRGLGIADGGYDDDDVCYAGTHTPSSMDSFVDEAAMFSPENSFPLPPPVAASMAQSRNHSSGYSAQFQEKQLKSLYDEHTISPKAAALLGRSVSVSAKAEDGLGKPKRRSSLLGGMPSLSLSPRFKKESSKQTTPDQTAEPFFPSTQSPSLLDEMAAFSPKSAGMASTQLLPTVSSPIMSSPVLGHAKNASTGTAQSIISSAPSTFSSSNGVKKDPRLLPSDRPLGIRLPSLPSSRSNLGGHAPASPSSVGQMPSRSAFLLKHQPFLATIKQRHGTWKPRFIVFTRFPQKSRYHLHVFKSDNLDEFESERLILTDKSVVCVTDEIAGGKLYVLKVTGLLLSLGTHNLADQIPDREDNWYFSMNDVSDLTTWMKLLKGIVLQLRGVVPQDVPAQELADPKTEAISIKENVRPVEDSTPVLRASPLPSPSISHPFAAHPYAAQPFPSSGRQEGPVNINLQAHDSFFPLSSHHRRNQSYATTADSVAINWRNSILSDNSIVSDDLWLEPRVARRLSTTAGDHTTGETALPQYLMQSLNIIPTSSRVHESKHDSWNGNSAPLRPAPNLPLPPLPSMPHPHHGASDITKHQSNRHSAQSALSDDSTAFSFNTTSSASNSINDKRSSANSAATALTVYSTHSDDREKHTVLNQSATQSPPRPSRNPLRNSPSLKDQDRFGAVSLSESGSLHIGRATEDKSIKSSKSDGSKGSFVAGSIALSVQPSRRPRNTNNSHLLQDLQEEGDQRSFVSGNSSDFDNVQSRSRAGRIIL